MGKFLGRRELGREAGQGRVRVEKLPRVTRLTAVRWLTALKESKSVVPLWRPKET